MNTRPTSTFFAGGARFDLPARRTGSVGRQTRICRNIGTPFNFERPVMDEEIHDARRPRVTVLNECGTVAAEPEEARRRRYDATPPG
jgi:hypothetical protein